MSRLCRGRIFDITQFIPAPEQALKDLERPARLAVHGYEVSGQVGAGTRTRVQIWQNRIQPEMTWVAVAGIAARGLVVEYNLELESADGIFAAHNIVAGTSGLRAAMGCSAELGWRHAPLCEFPAF